MSALAAILAGAWSRASAWIAAAGAALAVLLAAYAAGRRDGRAAADSETLRRAARAREIRDAVERDLDRTGDASGRLRRDWQRR